MPGEVAAQQLDKMAAEADADGSAREHGIGARTRGLGGKLRGSGGTSSLLGWLLVTIAAVGMLASTPPSAAPDEPVQAAAAWYMSEHVMPPAPTEVFPVPASLFVAPCYAGHPDRTAGCMAPRGNNTGMVQASSVVNYPPPYYWVVGGGQRIAALFGLQYADIGGRLASVVLNFGALFLLSLYMRRRNRRWGSLLLLVSTPMAVFMGIVVNPSGWETTSAIVMAAALSEAAWSRPGTASNTWPRGTLALLAIASVALCTARPLGFVWAASLTIAAIVLAPASSRRVLVRVACAVTPGIALGLLWATTHPATLPISATMATSPSTIPNLANFFAQSLSWFPERLRQVFGVLGWLDTPVPELLLLVNLVAWAAVLTRLPSIRRLAILWGILVVVILPSAIEALGWGVWPGWWQGRYSMPVALAFALLLLLRSGDRIPRTISIASAMSLLTLGVTVWINAIRYGFGITPSDLPASLGDPGMSTVRLGFSGAAGAILVLASVYLLLLASRRTPNRVSGQEAETRSAPTESDALGAGI
jgi:Predicted membrane protein (DUF2142)